MEENHFIQKPETREYKIQGEKIVLDINEKVFPPSSHGQFFAEEVKINSGEKVIDIGTGTGILAILAAKKGAQVWAIDTDIEAVELTSINAQKNCISINVRQGKYFADFEEKFDVILVNLPQEIITNNYKEKIGFNLTQTISGGDKGNKQLLELLDIAKKHMHKDSRLYVPVYTASDYKATIKKICQNYNAKLIALENVAMKSYIYRDLDFYLLLNYLGQIKIFKEDQIWKATEYIFELRIS